MLPAHGYPKINKFKHLAGNYGGAWALQKKEFDEFEGAILANTNCILVPKDSYRDRLFTSDITGIEGVRHINGPDFSPLIKRALELPKMKAKKGKTILTGFHYKNVLEIADKLIELIKQGKIRHFFLIGGCDTPGPKGNYYREFAKLVPKDCVILTLACGKYRFNDIDFGQIDGIPRLIDLGQCNNSFSALEIAKALFRPLGQIREQSAAFAGADLVRTKSRCDTAFAAAPWNKEYLYRAGRSRIHLERGFQDPQGHI